MAPKIRNVERLQHALRRLAADERENDKSEDDPSCKRVLVADVTTMLERVRRVCVVVDSVPTTGESLFCAQALTQESAAARVAVELVLVHIRKMVEWELSPQ